MITNQLSVQHLPILQIDLISPHNSSLLVPNIFLKSRILGTHGGEHEDGCLHFPEDFAYKHL
jgi:hypothetical protein